MGLHEHFSQISTAASDCMKRTLSEYTQPLGDIHVIDLDLQRWCDRITGPEHQMLVEARRNLAFAEYCVVQGLYRQAYTSLRLFLELTFAAVYFSVNEFERRRWQSNKVDFSWAKALDQTAGVLSGAFVTEFSPDLTDSSPKFAGQAADTYRKCSEFVHGKMIMLDLLPESIEYDATVVSDWLGTARDAASSALFLLLVRYGGDLDWPHDEDLCECVTSRFGTLKPIQDKIR